MRFFIAVFIGIVLLLGSCKEKVEIQNPKREQPEPKITIEKPVSPLIKELGKFANPTFSDSTIVNEFFLFKEINENGAVETVDVNRASVLYRKMMNREVATSWPVFEIKDTDTTILFVQSIGFGGAIWAKVLIDRKTLEIKNIEFEHKAESEGYGAAMTQSIFEDKFVGTKIDLEKNTFTLQKDIEKRMDDGTIIDEIVGATMTSQSIVEMVNYGLRKYRGYLDQQ